jgi:hypothetical protein
MPSKCWSVRICLLPGYGSRWFLLNNTKSLLRPRPTLASQSVPNQAHIAMPGSPCREIYTGVWLQRICSLGSTFIKAFNTNLNTVLQQQLRIVERLWDSGLDCHVPPSAWAYKTSVFNYRPRSHISGLLSILLARPLGVGLSTPLLTLLGPFSVHGT